MDFVSKKLGIEKKNLSLLFTLYFAFFTSGGVMTIMGSILPFIIKEYAFTYSQQGTMQSFYQIGTLFSVIFIAYIINAIGRKASVVILFSGISIGLIMIMLTGNYLLVLTAFAFVGISRGSISNLSNVTVSEISSNKTGALNILHATFAVGALITPFMTSLTTKTGNWRLPTTVMVVMGTISLVLLIISKMPNKTNELKPNVSTNKENSNKENSKKENKEKADLGFFRSKIFLTNCWILFFYIASESALTGWFVTYFKANSNIFISTKIAPISTSILWTMVLIGRLWTASVSNKIDKNKFVFLLSLSKLIFFIIMIATTNTTLILIGIIGVGFSMASLYPTVLSAGDPKYMSSSLATGVTIAFSMFGSVLMNELIGKVSDKFGPGYGMRMNLLPIVILAILTAFKMLSNKNLIDIK